MPNNKDWAAKFSLSELEEIKKQHGTTNDGECFMCCLIPETPNNITPAKSPCIVVQLCDEVIGYRNSVIDFADDMERIMNETYQL